MSYIAKCEEGGKMRPLREVFPIIEDIESWASMGITGHDWGRRLRLASFLDEVGEYREKAVKYDALLEAVDKICTPTPSVKMEVGESSASLQRSGGKMA